MTKSEEMNQITLEKLKIHERLSEVEKNIAVLITKIDARCNLCAAGSEILKEAVTKLSHIILGNGDIGLSEETRRVKLAIESIQSSNENRKENLRWLWRVSITTALSVVGAIIFEVFFRRN